MHAKQACQRGRDHRAAAAAFAIAVRLSGGIFSIRAFADALPPFRPSATAAGSFLRRALGFPCGPGGAGGPLLGACPVASRTTRSAFTLRSSASSLAVLKRLGMAKYGIEWIG